MTTLAHFRDPASQKSMWPETYFILNTAAAAVHITAFFLLLPLRPPKFWGRVEQTAPANIWAHENSKQIFGYFKLVFHNELLHWQINLFLVFSRARLHRQVRKISTLSVKQFKVFFLQKYPIFWTTNVQILFFWLNICIFTQVQTKKD